MSDIDDLFKENAAKNWQDREHRLKHLETLQTAAGGGGGRGPTADTSNKIISKSGSYTVLPSDLNIGYSLTLIATSAGTITLPDASDAGIYLSGATSDISVKRETSGAVTVATTSSQTIDSIYLTVSMAKGDTLTFQSDGSNWWII